MTLLDPRLVADWRLDEHEASHLPTDASGHLADLAVPAGLTRPDVAQGTLSGFGRAFTRAPATALEIDDAGALRLTRGLATIWLGRLDVASLVDDDIATLVQRGAGGAGDPIPFGLRVVVLDAVAGSCRLEMYWQTAAGADVVDAGAEFTWPPGAFLLLAGVREVIRGQLAVRYQVNGHSLAGEQNHSLDVGSSATAPIVMGAGRDGATYQDHWLGEIDAGSIVGEAVAPTELRWIWERISIDMPAGVKMIRAFVPPGDPFVYSPDPESDVQRELAMEGMALGYAKSLARRLRFYLLPDVAWGEVLEAWERILEARPHAGDDIATRQARVSGILGSFLGAGAEDIKIQLQETLGLDAADIELLEYDNDRSVPFDGSPEGGLRIEGNATIITDAGECVMDTGGAKDLEWRGPVTPGASLRIWGLASGVDAYVSGKVALLGTSGDAMAGLVLGSRKRDEWFFVGVRQTAGAPTNAIVWFKYQAGVTGSETVLAAAWNTSPTWITAHVLEDGTIDVRWGTSLANAQGSIFPANVDPGIEIPEWAGFAVAAPAGAAASDIEAYFDDFFSHTPEGHQRFNFWAYRDPLLPGTYDLEGARLLMQRIALGHNRVGATSTLAFTLGDDPANGLGEAPLGVGD